MNNKKIDKCLEELTNAIGMLLLLWVLYIIIIAIANDFGLLDIDYYNFFVDLYSFIWYN
jgi:hypothetical protein